MAPTERGSGVVGSRPLGTRRPWVYAGSLLALGLLLAASVARAHGDAPMREAPSREAPPAREPTQTPQKDPPPGQVPPRQGGCGCEVSPASRGSGAWSGLSLVVGVLVLAAGRRRYRYPPAEHRLARSMTDETGKSVLPVELQQRTSASLRGPSPTHEQRGRLATVRRLPGATEPTGS